MTPVLLLASSICLFITTVVASLLWGEEKRLREADATAFFASYRRSQDEVHKQRNKLLVKTNELEHLKSITKAKDDVLLKEFGIQYDPEQHKLVQYKTIFLKGCEA